MSAIGTGLAKAPADLSTRWVGDCPEAAVLLSSEPQPQGRAAPEMCGGGLELRGPWGGHQLSVRNANWFPGTH